MNSVVIWLKKHYPALCEGVFLLFIYLMGRLPLRDYDLWFHLKSGELFITQGHLQFTEVFSHSAYGREWIPYEWLFQVIVYLLSLIGLWTIPLFMGIFVVLMSFFFLRILDYIFHVPLIPRLMMAFFFFVSIYEFNTARPHVLAYSFVCMTIFLILTRVYKNRRWIYISPFLTLIWTNLHSTSFLSWGLPLSYGLLFLLTWLRTRKKEQLLIVRDLLIVTIVNFLITIGPPLWLRDYKLLWEFFQQRKFLGVFISEWGSITENPFGFAVYTSIFSLSTLSFILITFKKRQFVQNVWALPLILMGIMGYTASRNLVMASLGMFIILGWSIKELLPHISKMVRYFVLIPLAVAAIIFYGYTLNIKHQTIIMDRQYYPVQSAEFAKKYLHGNMFNDYTYGGYILYAVYPELQVMIDGRADVYLCCEMKDYILLAKYKNSPDKEYKKLLDKFWDEYHISFALLTTQKHSVMRQIARILNNDPQWALVFWDDDSEVFVRRDGKNDQIIKMLETKYATPYLRNPYVQGKENQAFQEYMRMDTITQTARTSNAIGYLLMKQGKLNEARKRFEEAVSKDPTFESPYMNMAELSAYDGNIGTAIDLYYKAQHLAPDRGLSYIRLGQLIIQQSGDTEKARKIWENGVKNTVDTDARKELQLLLSKY